MGRATRCDFFLFPCCVNSAYNRREWQPPARVQRFPLLPRDVRKWADPLPDALSRLNQIAPAWIIPDCHFRTEGKGKHQVLNVWPFFLKMWHP